MQILFHSHYLFNKDEMKLNSSLVLVNIFCTMINICNVITEDPKFIDIHITASRLICTKIKILFL